MSEHVSASVDRERFYNPFAELAHASGVLLDTAKGLKDGYFYQWMSSILVSAFALEGFLNLIGQRLFPCWKRLERRLSPIAKLELIAHAAQAPLDHNARPYQTIGKLFKFRNDLAHPKPQRLRPKPSREQGDLESIRRNYPRVPWEAECSAEFAQRVREDVAAVSQALCKAAGLEAYELPKGVDSYTIGFLDPPTRET